MLFSPIPGSVASSHSSLKYYIAFSFYYWTGRVTSADVTSSTSAAISLKIRSLITILLLVSS